MDDVAAKLIALIESNVPLGPLAGAAPEATPLTLEDFESAWESDWGVYPRCWSKAQQAVIHVVSPRQMAGLADGSVDFAFCANCGGVVWGAV